MSLLDLLSLAALGGLVALDGTALGQFMFSRPLVAATLAGGLLGDAAAGLAMGAVLELFYLAVVPVGGARFPEGGPAAVVAAAVGVAVPGSPGILAGVAVGMVWGALGGLTVGWLRRFNARLAPDPHSPLLTPRAVARVQVLCVGMDFFRGAIVAGTGAVLAQPVGELWGRVWPLGDGWTLGLLIVGAAVPLGALVRSFGNRRAALAAGVAAGVIVGLLV